MAKLVVCALFDRGIMAYGRPMYVPHVNSAVRSLTDEVNNPDSELHKHSADYDLFELGEWDDQDASFALLKSPRLVVGAGALLKQA